jgi:hypothetical protein
MINVGDRIQVKSAPWNPRIEGWLGEVILIRDVPPLPPNREGMSFSVKMDNKSKYKSYLLYENEVEIINSNKELL